MLYSQFDPAGNELRRQLFLTHSKRALTVEEPDGPPFRLIKSFAQYAIARLSADHCSRAAMIQDVCLYLRQT